MECLSLSCIDSMIMLLLCMAYYRNMQIYSHFIFVYLSTFPKSLLSTQGIYTEDNQGGSEFVKVVRSTYIFYRYISVN
jgi:hypothetical protein